MSNSMDRREVLGGAALLAAAPLLDGGEAAAETAGGLLNVHVLDLFSGTPASGVKLDLSVRDGDLMRTVKSVLTDADGRSGTLLAGDAFTAGRYVLAVDLSDYFRTADKSLPANFFRKLSLEFEVTDPTVPHHIPLQCTPWTQSCSVLPG